MLAGPYSDKLAAACAKVTQKLYRDLALYDCSQLLLRILQSFSMVNPPVMALRRRADELFTSAKREMAHNEDSGALLLFYAAECALKSTYMLKFNLRNTEDSRGTARSARSFVHDLLGLIAALHIPRASISALPAIVVSRTGTRAEVAVLHQAWRYGEKITDTAEICKWLTSLIEWCKRQA